MSNNIINVLLVDDQVLVRTGIKSLLANVKDIRVIGEAVNGEEAIRFAKEKKPDIILMDVKMPGISGLEATKRIVAYNNNHKVLALTSCNDSVFPIRLLRAGASGYLTKDCETEEMVSAIYKVYSGGRYIDPQIAQRLALKRFITKNESPFDLLSERELQVMLMIIAGKKVFDIASQLHLSPKTINTYRYRLFEKLGINNDVELTLMALRYNMIDHMVIGNMDHSQSIVEEKDQVE